MKINIKGNAVAPENVAEALKTCERDYGLKIKNITLYVRYENENGETVEPTHLGDAIIRDFTFNRTKEISQPAPEPISIEEMQELIEINTGRMMRPTEIKTLAFLYNQKIDKATFVDVLYKVIKAKPDFSMRYFERAAIGNMRKK